MLAMTYQIIIYNILYIYFDQIVPNEYGTNKKPLFFLQGFKKCFKKRSILDDSQDQVSLPL
jgi:ATP-binding cassette subfamily A (ABC1) protein 3